MRNRNIIHNQTSRRPGSRGRITREAGFTIVELMIATLVFSTILLVITVGVISFTNAYYKGINSSTTQDTARSIMDTISQSIQFSGSGISPTPTTGGTRYFCTNGQVYVYSLGVQYMGAAPTLSNPGLYVISTAQCALPTGPTLSGGKQLLAKHMRLAAFNVTQDTNVPQSYSVAIRLAYSSGGSANDGDDLLCSSTAPSTSVTNCDNKFVDGSQTASDYAYPDLICRIQSGSQFCSVSALTTTVIQRIDNS